MIWRERILEDFFKNPVLPMVSIKVMYATSLSFVVITMETNST